MKIEIHILQCFAPSCLNRDDTNTPKSCVFGGFPRSRISSQCWKRAVRSYFRDTNSQLVGNRTKRLQALLIDKLGNSVSPETITKFIVDCYSKMDGKNPADTAVLLFIGNEEVEEAAACLREKIDSKTAMARLQNARKSVDLALFGRMLAEKPDGSIDAACQVAHAISTHRVEMEDDFYTAVDDVLESRGEIGAGMMGVQGFNSACFYRYALLDTDQLLTNLHGDTAITAEAISAFIEAFSMSIPSAKQNSHAAQNLPSFGLLAARDSGAPVSLANAFARPVRSEDIIAASIDSLSDYHARLNKVYGLYDNATLAVFHDREDDSCLRDLKNSDKGSLKAATATIMEQVRL